MYRNGRSLLKIFLLIFIFVISTAGVLAQEINNEELQNWKNQAQAVASLIRNSNAGFNSALIDALTKIPRHLFVAETYSGVAYEDISLPGFDGRIVPSPTDLAVAINLLAPSETETVLIAGNNAGYAAAILSLLSDNVYLIEESSAAASYSKLFTDLQLNNIVIADRADINSFPEIRTFENIFIHAAVPEISERITEMLSIRGSIVFPLAGKGGFQQLVLLRRSLLGDYIKTGGTCFFPEAGFLKIGN
jgi:protein-L-isoaspartate(D-aspartate) O-methyltransferase